MPHDRIYSFNCEAVHAEAKRVRVRTAKGKRIKIIGCKSHQGGHDHKHDGHGHDHDHHNHDHHHHVVQYDDDDDILVDNYSNDMQYGSIGHSSKEHIFNVHQILDPHEKHIFGDSPNKNQNKLKDNVDIRSDVENLSARGDNSLDEKKDH